MAGSVPVEKSLLEKPLSLLPNIACLPSRVLSPCLALRTLAVLHHHLFCFGDRSGLVSGTNTGHGPEQSLMFSMIRFAFESLLKSEMVQVLFENYSSLPKNIFCYNCYTYT